MSVSISRHRRKVELITVYTYERIDEYDDGHTTCVITTLIVRNGITCERIWPHACV